VLAPHEAGPGRDCRRQKRAALDLPWVPDSTYRDQQAHRSPPRGQRVLLRPRRGLQSPPGLLSGHLAAGTLGPDQIGRDQTRRVRTVPPSGRSVRVLLEYDQATEASRALSRKLEGYLRLAAGWTREQELTGFPNLLVLVPEEEREEKVASAFRSAVAALHVSGSLASSFPLHVASEDRLTDLRVSNALESIGRWRKADSTTTANLRYRIDSAIRRASMRLTSSAGRLKATR
jgi:hypothetical protein